MYICINKFIVRYSKLNSMQEQDFAFYFAFNTEWYDPTSRLRRKFIVSYYPADETVAMVINYTNN